MSTREKKLLKFVSTLHLRIGQLIAVLFGIVGALELLLGLVGTSKLVLWVGLLLSFAAFIYLQKRVLELYRDIDEESAGGINHEYI